MSDPEVLAEGASVNQVSREAAQPPLLSPESLARFESLGGISRWASLENLAHLPSLPPLSDLYALFESTAYQPAHMSSPSPAVCPTVVRYACRHCMSGRVNLFGSIWHVSRDLKQCFSLQELCAAQAAACSFAWALSIDCDNTCRAELRLR